MHNYDTRSDLQKHTSVTTLTVSQKGENLYHIILILVPTPIHFALTVDVLSNHPEEYI